MTIIINSIDIADTRDALVVHLDGTTTERNELFWMIPMENDSSDKWAVVQHWLDAGNEITDNIAWQTVYADKRKMAYPSIEHQLDMLYWDKINGTDKWQAAIDAVKQQFPKPE
jgi:hypothetical protein